MVTIIVTEYNYKRKILIAAKQIRMVRDEGDYRQIYIKGKNSCIVTDTVERIQELIDR